MLCKRNYTGICINRMWIFLFILTMIKGFSLMASINNFQSPDFAFPKDVKAAAGKELSEAGKTGDPAKALQAAMQIVIADNLISGDNAKTGVELLDSLALKLPAPYSNLAWLLEARLLSDVYSADAWTYNNRMLPAGDVPEDIKAWSKDVFSREIIMLVEKSRRLAAADRDLPLSQLKGKVIDLNDGATAGMTVGDFIDEQSMDVLAPFAGSSTSRLPFIIEGESNERSSSATGSEAQTLSREICSEAIRRNESIQNLQVASIMSQRMLGLVDPAVAETLNKEYLNHYRQTPWCAAFILREIRQLNDEDDQSSSYRLLKSYLDEYPDCIGNRELGQALNELTAEKIFLTAPGQVLPEAPVKGEIDLRNLKKIYLLAVKMPDSFIGRNVTATELARSGKITTTIEISGAPDIPSHKKTEFEMPGLTPGVYALVCTRTGDLKTAIKNNGSTGYRTMLVSDLSVINASASGAEGGRIYVVSARNQKPIANARLSFTPSYAQKGIAPLNLVTNKEGYVVCPKGNYTVMIRKGESILETNSGGYYSTEGRPQTQIRGQLLTDLAIYHPGDSVKWAGAIYTEKGRDQHSLAGDEVNVILRNANGQELDTIRVTSDPLGRISGSVKLPVEGLLGNWGLELRDKKGNYVGSASFVVAEYKSPTFYVNIDNIDADQDKETVIITGTVKTYSGMPVADAEVKYTISYSPFRYWNYSGGNPGFGSEVRTDAGGEYKITLSTRDLAKSQYAKGRFTVKATSTDAAGETQESAPVSFGIGEYYTISARIPEKINADQGPSPVGIGVTNSAGYPVEKKVYYRILSERDNREVAQGEVSDRLFSYNYSALKSGDYKIEFSINPEFRNTEEGTVFTQTTVIYRPSDTLPPIETALWVEEDEIIAAQGVKTVKIRVGSSYPDSRILAQICATDGKTSYQWMEVSEGFALLSVSAPSESERIRVNLVGLHDLKSEQISITVVPAIQKEQLRVETITFRDQIESGSREDWKFRFIYNGMPMAGLPAMATMSNKALNAITPFQWNLNPAGDIYWSYPGYLSPDYQGQLRWWVTVNNGRNAKNDRRFDMPEWNLYGQSLYSKYFNRGIRIRGTRKAMAGGIVETEEEVSYNSAPMMMVVNEMKMEKTSDMALKESAVVSAADEGIEESGETGTLRDVEMASAFFMPSLVTDTQGEVSLKFRAPDFNGTWQLQIAGYTPEMKGTVLIKDVIASKSVMTQLNAPRFVRTGDRVQVSARLFNNTPTETLIKGKIEIFDPISGRVYDSVIENKTVDPMGGEAITIAYTVPDDLNMIGIRAYAIGADHTDGEQSIVPVYPSSTPVTESKPFYLSSEDTSFTIDLPSDRKGANVTLKYTANPVWECVMALPSLLNDESRNALSLASSLYASATAEGLISSNELVKAGLKVMLDPAFGEDSLAVSPLEKDQTLKIMSLNHTPWVNNSLSQTMRMQSLLDYLDNAKASEAISKAITALGDLQNPDGGWSWCEGMQSSRFVSEYVVMRMAELSRMGYLPGGVRSMAEAGIRYIDSKYAEELQKVGAKNFDYIGATDYLYARKQFGVAAGQSISAIRAGTVKALKSGWKKMDIRSKAMAARLLNSEGEEATAREILRSIGQYASQSKERGMWFDNLSSTSRYGSILTTACVLEAYTEIEPTSGDIDRLRQWLLQTLQTQDWGDTRSTAGAVNALLQSGSDWLAASGSVMPRIYINGEEVTPAKVALLTGEITLDLSGRSGSLRIERTPGVPAWGGIISQYVAPIREVKDAGSAQLKIHKDIYRIRRDGTETTVSEQDLSTGDLIRVSLTVKSDRDLEYVALRDNRPGCLEPTEQVSGYTGSDGIRYYKEVRNQSVNLYIPFLPKGTHVIHYEGHIDRAGEYASGIAEAQSQYAPVISAHSAGKEISVK